MSYTGLGIISLISLLWVCYTALGQKRTFSNMLMTLRIMLAIIFGILDAVAYYLFERKREKANY